MFFNEKFFSFLINGISAQSLHPQYKAPWRPTTVQYLKPPILFFSHQAFLFPGILTIRGDSSVFDTDSSQTTQFLQPDVMTAGVGAERQVCQKP